MLRGLLIFVTMIIVSLYYFPFSFAFLPGMTGKTVMAVVGLFLFAYQRAIKRSSDFDKDMYILIIYALAVSLIGLISVSFNNTSDYTYATYIVSMLVWMSAAYVVCSVIKAVHGHISFLLICNYLIAVCVGQCVLALMIDFMPSVRAFAIAVMGPQDDVEKMKRLYGFGASLDTAGIRFSVVLVMIAFLLSKFGRYLYKKDIWCYIGAFIVLTVIGNMMARTTLVGVGLSLFYLVYASNVYKGLMRRGIWIDIIGFICLAIPIVIYFYNTNTAIHEYTHFAFEGFFSLFETGEWEVGSNEILKSMYVFPETLKTWIIGDGYFNNPIYTDPYYTGEVYGGYYMGTDVGYLRFIFYFGLIGLTAFSLFIYRAYMTCHNRFPYFRDLFFMVLLINFIVWFKVSTDIFLVFALFLMVDRKEDDAFMERIVLKEQ